MASVLDARQDADLTDTDSGVVAGWAALIYGSVVALHCRCRLAAVGFRIPSFAIFQLTLPDRLCRHACSPASAEALPMMARAASLNLFPETAPAPADGRK
jgi:hypothetical protein